MIRAAFPIISANSGSDVYFRLLKKSLQAYNVTADIIPLPYRYEFVPGLAATLRKQLADYDLIHTNADYGHLFKYQGKPLVTTFHHDVFDPINYQQASAAQKIYYQLLLRPRLLKSASISDAVICPSHYSFECLKRYHPSQPQTIFNGIDLHWFRPAESCKRDEKQLLFVGTLSKRKGVDLLPLIMDRLSKDGYRLTCVGKKSRSPLADHPNIHYTGRISDAELLKLYQSASCLVFPSRLEGFGYSIAEAAACHCPIVASNQSAIPEVLENYPACQLVDSFDAQVWASAIRTQTEQDPVDFSSSDFDINRFSLESMGGHYANLYSRLLESSQTG